MKSEVRNLNEEPKNLPFPKLMISDKGTIILATCVEAGEITGTMVSEGKITYGNGMGRHSNSWSIRNFKDLPEGVEVVLSNKR